MASNNQLTLDQAYQAAYLWLDHVGDPPVEISEPAHGAVELITENAFVRVRSSDTPVEQSSVLALLRAAESGKRLLIFSPSGFSPGALAIAETQGIALYTLDSSGTAHPETTHARSLAPATDPDPPFAPSEEEAEGGFWGDFEAGRPLQQSAEEDPDEPSIDAATTDWADCPNCGATHYRNARFCRECGANLGGASDKSGVNQAGSHDHSGSPVPAAGKLRCRVCGSHDIELLE
ncbi:MAG: zinc-ribbon domain-containing protein [Acidimicrobiia bacterium]